MNELFERLRSELISRKPSGLPRKPIVDLFIGKDREIGREQRSQEKRVGITPQHVEDLKALFKALGIGLNVFVMQGAGQRAGFPDSDYIRSGAEILAESELEYHDRAPDVFHALKEPSKYESLLPTPFCRIGAVHGGNFHATSGLASLLGKGDVIIFDGSATGAPDAFRIPIRGRMSMFAGEIAAEWIADHLRDQKINGRVVIVGGGRAGQSAARMLNEFDFISEIHLFEDKGAEGRIERVRKDMADLVKVKVLGLEGRDDPDLLSSLNQECAAVLFAVARPGEEAPKVVHVSRLTGLREKTIIVDISIDEKGAIFDPSIAPDWEASRIIKHLEPILKRKSIVYRAQENMPRSRAQQASEAHGDVILPYIATLLYLAAWEGGVKGVRDLMARRSVDMKCEDPLRAPEGQLKDALTQDLRNGLAFYTRSDRVVIEDIVPDRVNLLSFLLMRKIPFEFSLPLRESVKKEKLREMERALELFPEDVREFLQFAFTKGVTGSVISHPKIDGTTTRDAATALSEPVANVVKTLIWKKDDELVATISSGVKHVDEHRLRAVTRAHEIKLAEPNEVMTATGHVPGAVPIIGLFKFNKEGIIKAIYVSEEVLSLPLVCGSAGSVFLGVRFEPTYLVQLGAVKAALTPPDSILRTSEKEISKLLRRIEKATELDDDEAAIKAVHRLQTILQGDHSPGEH
jgi:alanine dehydrogenase